MKRIILSIGLAILTSFSICSYAVSEDVWMFRRGTSQKEMLGFLKEKGTFSTNGSYWVGPMLKIFGAFSLDKQRSTFDVYVDKHGNYLSIVWKEKRSLSLVERHQGLRTYTENSYRVKWPRGEIMRTKPLRLKYNGCSTIRTVLDVEDRSSGQTLRAYIATLYSTGRTYDILLVHSHEIPGMKGSRDVNYWNDRFKLFFDSFLMEFLPVDDNGYLPRQKER